MRFHGIAFDGCSFDLGEVAKVGIPKKMFKNAWKNEHRNGVTYFYKRLNEKWKVLRTNEVCS